MNPHPLAAGIRRARTHPTLLLDVVLVPRDLACPRCGGVNFADIRGADLDGCPAKRCKGCGTGFRVLVAASADIVAAIAETSTADACPATVHESVERDAENGDLDDEDRELAGDVLRAWRVRLAAIRSRKRMDDDAPPLDEDLALLERARVSSRPAHRSAFHRQALRAPVTPV